MKPVILLLEDEEDLLHVLAQALHLAQPGYEVVSCATSEHALHTLGELQGAGRPLALVVVDHMLGGATGLDFLERARALYPEVAGILFTGRAHRDIEAQARALDATVLWKPVRLSHWLGEVGAALSPARSESITV